MSGMADHEYEITSSIQRSMAQVADLCTQLGAGYHAALDSENGDRLERAAERWRQAIDGALREWAAADRRETLRATAAADVETPWCPTPASEGVPDVH